MTTPSVSEQPQQQHDAVVLFYKYFDNKNSSSAIRWLRQYPEFYLDHVYRFQKDVCNRLGLKGRILLATEGINGTLSGASKEAIREYRKAMEGFDLIGSAGYPDEGATTKIGQPFSVDVKEDNPFIFSGIDWKESFLHSSTTCAAEEIREPFPNLKVSIVKELVSSGGAVSVDDLNDYGGIHLSPEEFHEKLVGSSISNDSNNSTSSKDVVLIDVRNTFEHAIGHFVNPYTQQAAMNPEMVTFSSFDPKFCEQHAPSLKDKTVLMYCTGGIRCEKASAMLKKRGVKDVYQLQGGIHRYLETFGEEGCFKGRNFQFDQRIALSPAEHYQQRKLLDDTVVESDTPELKEDNKLQPPKVVGKCMECHTAYDELSGSRICTVCRDLVLVCPSCQIQLREYHCLRHSEWKDYYTFLEVFGKEQLEAQVSSMQYLLDRHTEYSKHVKKTLRKQIRKIRDRLEEIEKNPDLVNPDAPRRCRSCREPSNICNGLCWGFWKTSSTGNDNCSIANYAAEPILPIQVGDTVKAGPHWNAIRYGNPIHPETGVALKGTVTEIKSWGTGSTELDCVAVAWNDPEHLPRRRQVQIYRWGAKAVNGSRLYDVVRCD